VNEYKSCVIRQVANGWVVVVYIPGTLGTQTTVGTAPTESETYYADIATATAAIAAVL